MSKTLEQYSTIAKLLKLDILKVKLSNQQLQRKLGPSSFPNPTQPPPPSPMTLTSATDPLHLLYCDMQTFSSSLRRVSLTPEMFYRLCDTKRSKVISVSDFSKWSSRLGLRLDRERLDRICLKLDEKKNGMIELKKYLKYVKAFQIGGEQGEEVVQEGLRKMAVLVGGTGLGVLDSEKLMDFRDFQRLVQKQVKDIDQAELTAIYIHFDTAHQFKLSTDVIYKRIIELSGQKQTLTKTPENSKPASARDKKPNVFEQDDDRGQDKENQEENVEKEKKPVKNQKDDETNRKAIDEAKAILQNKKLDYGKLLNNLLISDRSSNTLPLHRGFTLMQFQTAVKASGLSLSPHQSKTLFRAIDKTGCGTITCIYLCHFYLLNRPDKLYSPLIPILAYQACSSSETTQAYLQSNGIQAKQKLSLEKFSKLLESFDLTEGEKKGFYEELRGKDQVLSGQKLGKIVGEGVRSLRKGKSKKQKTLGEDS